MNFCINPKSEKVISLANELGLPVNVTAAKIGHWMKTNDNQSFNAEDISKTRLITEEIKKLPQEISNNIRVVFDVDESIIGNPDNLFSIQKVFDKTGATITERTLLGWLGKYQNEIDIYSIKTEEDLEKQIEKKYNKLLLLLKNIKGKTKVINQRFNDWEKILEEYPVYYKHSILDSVYKEYLKNKNRRQVVLSPINNVTLNETFNYINQNPHEINRVFKLYNSGIIDTHSKSSITFPTENGIGHWVLIPKTNKSNKSYNANFTKLQNLYYDN
jgi:hypothetical protein